MSVTSNQINVGSLPNDGTGDLIRDAFIKLNTNMSQYDAFILDNVITIGLVALTVDITTTLVAANSTNAKPTLCVKLDATAHTAFFADPNGITWSLTVQNECVRLIPIPALNIWVKQG